MSDIKIRERHGTFKNQRYLLSIGRMEVDPPFIMEQLINLLIPYRKALKSLKIVMLNGCKYGNDKMQFMEFNNTVTHSCE